MSQDEAHTARIAALNDRLRRHCLGGHVVMTATVAALDPDAQASLIAKLRTFDAFTEANDPEPASAKAGGEHDFGAIDHAGERYLWKIDTYADASLTFGADDPLSPSAVRVLTLMHSSEY